MTTGGTFRKKRRAVLRAYVIPATLNGPPGFTNCLYLHSVLWMIMETPPVELPNVLCSNLVELIHLQIGEKMY